MSTLRAEVRGAARDAVGEEVESPQRERDLELASTVYPGYPVDAERAAPLRIAVISLIPWRGIWRTSTERSP